MTLLTFLLLIIPLLVYPEPWFGPFKNEYLLKEYALIVLFFVIAARGLQTVLRAKSVTIKNTDKLYLLYIIFAAISYIINRPLSYSSLLSIALYGAVFVAASHKNPATIFPNGICWLWVTALVVSGSVGLHQRISHEPVVSLFGNRNFYGGYIVAGLPFVVYLTAHHLRTKKLLFAAVNVAISVVSLVNLFATRSRGAWLVLVAQFIAVMIIISGKKRKLIVSAGVVGIVVMMFLPWIRHTISDQLEHDVRPYIWEGTFYMICDHPLTGVGPGNFYREYPRYRVHDYFLSPKATDTTRHAHNELLEVWAETGSLGLITLVGIFAYLGLCLFKRNKKAPLHPFVWCLVLSTGGILLHNMVDVNMQFTATAVVFWVQLGLIAAYVERGNDISLPAIPRVIKPVTWLMFAVCVVYITWNSIIQPVQSQIHFQQGIDAKEAGNWQQAIDEYSQGLTADPTNLSLMYHLGYAFDQIGNTEQAIATYRLIASVAPYYAQVRKNLGTLYLKANRFEEALDQYKIQQMLDPYDPDIYLNMAYCYHQTGQASLAQETRRQALSVYKNKARLYLGVNRPFLAIPLLETALQLSKDDELIELLARAYLQSGNTGKADELLLIYREHFPDNTATIKTLQSLIQTYKK